ncbi:MAG: hypothetical protein ACFFB9_13225 [Promethearchaeota archaeon]
MVENIIKTFKLNFDGTFDEIAYENIKDVFTIVNILAIYAQKIKTMYIWIGRSASQALKKHISQIRLLLKDEFPDFRIIRNITFDMRAEPLEFFNNLNMKKEELYEIINYQEKTVLPILTKIDGLKEKSEKLIQSEQYKNAIYLLKEIIELAKKIQDDALLTEQKMLISELTEKYENNEIVSEIERESIKIKKEYNELVKTHQILKAHELVENFINKYEAIYDLTLIPDAKELIIKERRKWNSEQEKIRNDLNILEKDLKFSLENLELSKATEIFEKGLILLSNLIDEKIRTEWEALKKNIQNAKEKLNFIEKFDLFSKEFSRLKQNFQYKELKSRINELIKQVEMIDLPEYRSKLNLLKEKVESGEHVYNKTNNEIIELEKKLKIDMKNNLFHDILEDCDKIITLANSIGKIDLVESYYKTLELIKKKIKEEKDSKEKQEKLKEELLKLEEKFQVSLKAMEIDKLDNILEMGSDFISEIVDNDIKKKWRDFKTKFINAKRLLEEVDLLSKNAIEALYNGSFSDSLEFFEKIIIQLQEHRN